MATGNIYDDDYDFDHLNEEEKEAWDAYLYSPRLEHLIEVVTHALGGGSSPRVSRAALENTANCAFESAIWAGRSKRIDPCVETYLASDLYNEELTRIARPFGISKERLHACQPLRDLVVDAFEAGARAVVPIRAVPSRFERVLLEVA